MKLLHGDCLDLMGDIPDGSVDLTVTSPPYDNLRTYNNKLVWNWDIFTGIADHLFRVTKQGGVVVWVVGDATIDGSETGTSFKQALYFKNVGFNLHDTMVWKKNPLPLNHNRYEQNIEYMFVLSKGKVSTFNGIRKSCVCFGRGYPGGSTRQGGDDSRKHNTQRDIKPDKLIGNVWEIDTGYMRATKDRIAYLHPAIFPEQLAHDHIISWSNEGDTVLDPMMGSGTTGKMAKLLNRRFIGIEKDPEYFKIASERIEMETQQLKLFGVG